MKSWDKVFGKHKLDEIHGLENPLHGDLSTKREIKEDEGNQATFHN